MFLSNLLVCTFSSKYTQPTCVKSHRLILFLVASTVATLCLVSNSFVLMAFPSLITRLLHQNYTVKPLVNILRISLEVTLFILWLLTGIYFVIKTEKLDFVNTKVDSAPIEIWNMGIQLSIAETYGYTPDLFNSRLLYYSGVC